VKSCFFYKHNEPYIVGNIVSGVIAEKMTGEINGKSFEVIELNSKYGDAGIAKKGMTVGICVKGLENESIQKGAVIVFKPCEPAAAQ
jgi:GTPase